MALLLTAGADAAYAGARFAHYAVGSDNGYNQAVPLNEAGHDPRLECVVNLLAYGA